MEPILDASKPVVCDLSELIGLGAAELARRIADGSVSSRDVVQAHINYLQSVDAKLNTVVSERFDQAVKEAQAADELQSSEVPLGPLHGVPISVKDCFDVAGMPTTLGTLSLSRQIAERDTTLVTRLRAAGAIVICKTNVSQLMVYGETDNPHFGRTNNPWDLQRTSGGSSGGEAAIVAVGGSALGIGSDMAGSVRVPAHFCGIHAFMPTCGLVPLVGVQSAFAGITALQNAPGPMALHTEDLVLATNVIKRPSRSVRFDYGYPVADFRPQMVDIKSLRIAVWEDDGYFTPSPAISRVTREAADKLSAAGARVEPFQPPDVEAMVRLLLSLLSGNGGANIKRLLQGEKKNPLLRQLYHAVSLPPWLRWPIKFCLQLTGHEKRAELLSYLKPLNTDQYWQVSHRVNQYRAQFAKLWQVGGFDVAVCPPFGVPAFPHGKSLDGLHASSYAFLSNLLRTPAGVVAAGKIGELEQFESSRGRPFESASIQMAEQGSVGLPVGVQVFGPPHSDNTVLGVMRFLEQQFRQESDCPEMAVVG